MNYNYMTDLLDLGYNVRNIKWDENKYLSKDNGSILINDGKSSYNYCPSLDDMKSCEWTIKH